MATVSPLGANKPWTSRRWLDRPPEPDVHTALWSLGGSRPLVSWVQARAWTESPGAPEPEAYLHCPVRTDRARRIRAARRRADIEPRFRDGATSRRSTPTGLNVSWKPTTGRSAVSSSFQGIPSRLRRSGILSPVVCTAAVAPDAAALREPREEVRDAPAGAAGRQLDFGGNSPRSSSR